MWWASLTFGGDVSSADCLSVREGETDSSSILLASMPDCSWTDKECIKAKLTATENAGDSDSYSNWTFTADCPHCVCSERNVALFRLGHIIIIIIILDWICTVLFKALVSLYTEPIIIYTTFTLLVMASYMWGHSCPVGGKLTEAWQPNSGFDHHRTSFHIRTRQWGRSVLPKDTTTDSAGTGFEPLTLWATVLVLSDNLLYVATDIVAWASSSLVCRV